MKSRSHTALERYFEGPALELEVLSVVIALSLLLK